MNPTSHLVDGFKVSVNPCWYCGFTPVQLRTLAGSGADKFCFACPNEHCETYWRSPKNEMWQPSKQRAADKWNEENRLASVLEALKL